MDDIATAAVEAALAAGASYADARVMETRTEAMAARNGAVETLDREERAGVGVRALIGSSWGFFSVPDVGSAAARRAGEQAAAVARASALVAGPGPQARPGDARPGLMGIGVPGRPLERQPRREGRPPRGRDPDARRERRRRRGSRPPDLGHPQVARLERGHPRRPAHRRVRRAHERDRGRRRRDPAALLPRHPRPVRDPRLGARPRDRPARPGGPRRKRGPGAAQRGPLPLVRGDGPDPRRRADGAPDPRVGRPRDGARPDPRLGGGVRRHVLARPEAAGLAPLRQRPHEHHRRRDAARVAGQLRLRRRGHARPPGRHREGRHLGRDAERPRLRRARRASNDPVAPSGPRASTGCRWSG